MSHCSTCHQPLATHARFCPSCGAANLPSGGGGGGLSRVTGDTWRREEDELIVRVPHDQLESAGLVGSEIKVPRGTVCVSVKGDEIQDVLRPGVRTASGFFETLKRWTVGGERADFFLVSCEAIPLIFTRELAQGDRSTRFVITAHVQLFDAEAGRDRLNTLLNQVLRAQDKFTVDDLMALLMPQVIPEVNQALQQSGGDLARIERNLQSALTPRFGALGMSAQLSAKRTAQRRALQLHLGRESKAQTKRCLSCHAELNAVASFCGQCGGQQLSASSTSESAVLPLVTRDEKRVELDLILNLEGTGGLSDLEGLPQQVASLTAGYLAQVDFAALSSPAGLEAVERHLQGQITLVQGGIKVDSVTALDIRDPHGRWLLDARAGLEQERARLALSREELTLQHEAVDVQRLAHDLALTNQRLQRELAFNQRRQEAEFEQEQMRAELAEGRARDQLVLDDREARAQLLDRHSAQDQLDSARARDRELALDANQRVVDRHRSEQDHIDHVRRFHQDREMQGLHGAARREDEVTETAHRQGLEQRAADHRRAQEGADATHHDQIARMNFARDMEMRATSAGVEQEIARNRSALDQENRDREHGREMEREQLKQQRIQQAIALEHEAKMAEINANVAIATHDDKLSAARESAAQQERFRHEMQNMMAQNQQLQNQTVQALTAALSGQRVPPMQPAPPMQGYTPAAPPAPAPHGVARATTCPHCGVESEGAKFCASCGRAQS